MGKLKRKTSIDPTWDIHENSEDRLNRHIWLTGESNMLEPGDEPGIEWGLADSVFDGDWKGLLP